MRVILRENVDNLGTVGDLVQVSDGYARNFLLPRRLVVIANETNKRELEHHQRVLEKKRAAMRSGAEKLVEKLAELQCTIVRKVGKNDKLFGSVTAHDISEELSKAGHVLPKGAVRLKDPIKELGVHEVTVRLHPDVSAKVKVWVAKEEEQ